MKNSSIINEKGCEFGLLYRSFVTYKEFREQYDKFIPTLIEKNIMIKNIPLYDYLNWNLPRSIVLDLSGLFRNEIFKENKNRLIRALFLGSPFVSIEFSTCM